MATTIEKLIAEVQMKMGNVHRELDQLNRKLDETARDRKAKITLDPDGPDRRQVQRQVDAATRGVRGKVQIDVDDSLLRQTFRRLNSNNEFGKLSRDALVPLIKVPLIASSMGPAINLIQSAIPAIAGLGTQLGSISGVVAAMPAGFAAMAQTVVVGKLAFGDAAKAAKDYNTALASGDPQKIKQAQDDLNKALKDFSPASKQVVKDATELGQTFRKEVGGAVREAVLPAFGGVIDGLKSNMDVLKGGLAGTGDQFFGGLARGIGDWTKTPMFSKDLFTILALNNKGLGDMSAGIVSLAKGFMNLAITAYPVTNFLSGKFKELASDFKAWAQAGRETGGLNDFFQKTARNADRLMDIFGNLYQITKGFFRPASDMGTSMFETLDNSTKRLADRINSFSGQNKLKQYFTDLKPILHEFGGVLSDVFGMFTEVVKPERAEQFLKLIRSDVIPAVRSIITSANESNLFTVMMDAIPPLIDMFGQFIGPTGVLTDTIQIIGDMVGSLGNLINTTEHLGPVLVNAAGAFGVFKSLGMGGPIGMGVSLFVGILKEFGVELDKLTPLIVGFGAAFGTWKLMQTLGDVQKLTGAMAGLGVVAPKGSQFAANLAGTAAQTAAGAGGAGTGVVGAAGAGAGAAGLAGMLPALGITALVGGIIAGVEEYQSTKAEERQRAKSVGDIVVQSNTKDFRSDLRKDFMKNLEDWGMTDDLAKSGLGADAYLKRIGANAGVLQQTGLTYRDGKLYKTVNGGTGDSAGTQVEAKVSKGYLNQLRKLEASGQDVNTILQNDRDQAQALKDATKAKYDDLRAQGLLTKSQQDYIIKVSKSNDGTRNYYKELENLNKELNFTEDAQGKVNNIINKLKDEMVKTTAAPVDAATNIRNFFQTFADGKKSLDELSNSGKKFVDVLNPMDQAGREAYGTLKGIATAQLEFAKAQYDSTGNIMEYRDNLVKSRDTINELAGKLGLGKDQLKLLDEQIGVSDRQIIVNLQMTQAEELQNRLNIWDKEIQDFAPSDKKTLTTFLDNKDIPGELAWLKAKLDEVSQNKSVTVSVRLNEKEFQAAKARMDSLGIDIAPSLGPAKTKKDKAWDYINSRGRGDDWDFDKTTGMPTRNKKTGKTWAQFVAENPGLGLANGGLIKFGNGGMTKERHEAQIAPAGAWRVWAEPETGGEAYIPLHPSKRDRSISIWEETGRQLGVFADGGISFARLFSETITKATKTAKNNVGNIANVSGPALAALAAYKVGLRGEPLVTATAVAGPESGYNPRAHGVGPRDDSYGLWQINMLGRMGPARRKSMGLRSNDELYQPLINAKAMKDISSGGANWRPWSAYTTGRYRKFLAKARDAVSRINGSMDLPDESMDDSDVEAGPLNTKGSPIKGLTPEATRMGNAVKNAIKGTVFSSTLRPGAITAHTHKKSLHGFGKAIDFTGNKPAIFNFLKQNYSRLGLQELIFQHQIIKRGKQGVWKWNDHFDHVHGAVYADGGFAFFDDGGMEVGWYTPEGGDHAIFGPHPVSRKKKGKKKPAPKPKKGYSMTEMMLYGLTGSSRPGGSSADAMERNAHPDLVAAIMTGPSSVVGGDKGGSRSQKAKAAARVRAAGGGKASVISAPYMPWLNVKGTPFVLDPNDPELLQLTKAFMYSGLTWDQVGRDASGDVVGKSLNAHYRLIKALKLIGTVGDVQIDGSSTFSGANDTNLIIGAPGGGYWTPDGAFSARAEWLAPGVQKSYLDPEGNPYVPGPMMYGRGGVEKHTAQIASPGMVRVWAEPETGGEAYIPLHPSKRDKSVAVWHETGKRLGVFADGGITGRHVPDEALHEMSAFSPGKPSRHHDSPLIGEVHVHDEADLELMMHKLTMAFSGRR